MVISYTILLYTKPGKEAVFDFSKIFLFVLLYGINQFISLHPLLERKGWLKG